LRWLLLLLILGAWLRVAGIGASSLWSDEAFSWAVADLARAHDPLEVAYGPVVSADVHPPLHMLVLAVWMRVTGDSEPALRMLSALASILTLPALYLLGRALFGQRAGVLALLLGVLSPFQIVYAQEARQYALVVCLAAWMLVGMANMLRGRRRGAMLFALTGVMGLYTLHFFGLLLAATHLWPLLNPAARRHWRLWMVADAMIGLLYLPQLPVTLAQFQAISGGYWPDTPSIASPMATSAFLLYATTLPRDALSMVAIVLIISVLIIGGIDIWRYTPTPLRATWLIGAAILYVPMFAVLATTVARIAIYVDRSFSPFAPLLLVLLAGGLAYARRSSPAPLFVTGIICLMLIGTVRHLALPDPGKPPFQDIAAELTARSDVGAMPVILLHDGAFLPLHYYAPDLAARAQVVDMGERSWITSPAIWPVLSISRTSRAELERWLNTYQGDMRLIVTGNLEPPEIQTFIRLREGSLGTCIERDAVDYPPFVTVFTFTCGPPGSGQE
jgi:4-amino-4-deoxy-L-arabinose transferase-like glycosyltransferase